MYAMRPWSNYYEINQAIWTSAHHTQFMDPGWLYVGGDGGRGNLVHGGSWVSLVSPPQEKQEQQDVTIVIEKLHGKCLRCPGQSTEKENFIFLLAPSLATNRSSLSFWMTNQTVSFHRLPDVPVDPVTGSVTIEVEPDTIYTVSSLRGQTKGIPLHAIPKDVREIIDVFISFVHNTL
jgi:galactosylceramidase